MFLRLCGGHNIPSACLDIRANRVHSTQTRSTYVDCHRYTFTGRRKVVYLPSSLPSTVSSNRLSFSKATLIFYHFFFVALQNRAKTTTTVPRRRWMLGLTVWSAPLPSALLSVGLAFTPTSEDEHWMDVSFLSLPHRNTYRACVVFF